MPWFQQEPHIRWNNYGSMYALATFMFRAAQDLGYPIVWGGHWRSFPDYPHYQLIIPVDPITQDAA